MLAWLVLVNRLFNNKKHSGIGDFSLLLHKDDSQVSAGGFRVACQSTNHQPTINQPSTKRLDHPVHPHAMASCHSGIGKPGIGVEYILQVCLPEIFGIQGTRGKSCSKKSCTTKFLLFCKKMSVTTGDQMVTTSFSHKWTPCRPRQPRDVAFFYARVTT